MFKWGFFFFFKGLLLLQTGSNVIDPNNYHVCEGRPVFENHPFMCRYVCLCIGMIIWRVRVCVLRNKVKTSVCIICDERVDWKIKRLSFCCCRRHIVVARWVIYIIIVSLYPSRNLCRSPTRRSCVNIYYLVGKWIFYVKNIWYTLYVYNILWWFQTRLMGVFFFLQRKSKGPSYPKREIEWLYFCLMFVYYNISLCMYPVSLE